MKYDAGNCMLNIEIPCVPLNEAHTYLADYRFFEGNISDLQPIDKLIPYDLNTPSFSDYAEKSRFIYVPEDSSAVYRTSESVQFPVGSVLIKSFHYRGKATDASSKRIMLETRLLVKYKWGWTAETYVWNRDQTEAIREGAGDVKEVVWVNSEGIQRNIDYLIPSKNDCKNCHSQNNRIIPLGPKARNLNKYYDYSGNRENQLHRWYELGVLNSIPVPDSIPKLPVWDDSSTGTLNERARAYLDVNCSMCHNPGGAANNSSLFLHWEGTNNFNLGIYKPPIAPGRGSGGLKYDIVPGNPDSSIMIYRMESVEPEIRMPELGRTIVHEEAVALIREWIESLE